MDSLNNYKAPLSNSETLDIRKIKSQLYKYWHVFIISIIVCFGVSFLYLRYSTSKYKVNATILVQDDKKGADLPNSDLLNQLGLGGKSNVDNEVEVLKSRTLMEKVVNELSIFIEYYEDGRIKNFELFKELPFEFQCIKLEKDSIKYGFDYNWQLGRDTLSGSGISGQSIEIPYKYGDTLKLKEGLFRIRKKLSYIRTPPSLIRIHIRNPDDVVAELLRDVLISVPNKQVTTIQINMPTSTPLKGEDILNKLIEVYLRSNVEDKNRIADSTMHFIDDRVKIIGQELSDIDKDIQVFKERNKITDITAQSQALIQNAANNLDQLTQQQVQLMVVETLQGYLNDNANNKRVVTVSLVVQDPGFVELLSSYNSLQLEREKVLLSSTEKNPTILSIDQQLEQLRGNMRKSLVAIRKGLETAVNELKRQTNLFDNQTKSVPEKERLYLEKSRMQTVKQQLFLFLLQKREETAVSKSSTLANARVIDDAKADSIPYQPQKLIIYLSALLLGIVIPIVIIYIIDKFDSSVKSKDDIQSRISIPVIGEISHYSGSELIPVKKETRSMLSEQFRMLRTNLQYIIGGAEKSVILFTSSMSGEGKSFVSLNLAYTMALTGKKILYIELDLRKPRLTEKLNLSINKGFSNFAIGQASLNEIIVKSNLDDNLWVIPAGPVPPNPAELLLMDKSQTVLEDIKQQFDIIIIDTPPVGLVTDPLLIAKRVDATIFMVRQGATQNDQIAHLASIYKNMNDQRAGIVLNDVKSSSGYPYGYKYGYGYGYYHENAKKRLFWGLLRRKN